MTRIQPVDPAHARGRARTLLDGVQKKLGFAPNMLRAMAQSPAALDAYLAFGNALAGGALSAGLREQIALAVAGSNSCGYCASAHTAIGRQLGLDADELGTNLQGRASDPKVRAALDFARRVVDERGWVDDGDVERVREAGFTDGEIAEIIANVALNLYTNYFNHISAVEIDFPVVEVETPVRA